MDLTDYKTKVEEKWLLFRQAKKTYAKERQRTIELEDRLFCAEEAQVFLQQAAETFQAEAHKQIATIVSECLEAIFDEPYEFKILFERKRGKTEARLVFLREGLEYDPMSASGGGVVDVASFALHLSCLMLTQPSKRKLLVLDEPFRFVSAEYRGRIASMLETLAEELGVQFLIVTHMEELKIGKVINLGGE